VYTKFSEFFDSKKSLMIAKFIQQRLPRQIYFSTVSKYDLFNPSEQHSQLRSMVRAFCEAEVVPQAKEWNEKEKFNVELFRKLGKLGLLGITVPEEYGGSGLAKILWRVKRLSPP
jgi:alkylation response protein AidB-like acyl-CoA dehydrogenase